MEYQILGPRQQRMLAGNSGKWLVTGAAGFIGSNIVEALLGAGQFVVGLDNFATGHRRNLDEVHAAVGDANWGRFHLIEGDIRDLEACREAVRGASYVLHQAALGSVPRSIDDPITTHNVNTLGSLNMLVAARDQKVNSFVYAASSSAYGDDPDLPKREGKVGSPLSPYAVTKRVNELYAEVFHRCYDVPTLGLRYFNVFGRRQDPAGPYAAVIPRWIAAMIDDGMVEINGDGKTSRDFCYVNNVVQANIGAALAGPDAHGQVYNIAVGTGTSLTDLFKLLVHHLRMHHVDYRREPHYMPFRPGDVRHSEADISKARAQFGYEPAFTLTEGLREAMGWYVARFLPYSAVAIGQTS